MEIIIKFQKLNKVLDEGDKLEQFFSLMKKLNGDKDINMDLKIKI